MLDRLLMYLNGKKLAIFTILNLLSATLLKEGIINANWNLFIVGSLAILAGGAIVVTGIMMGRVMSGECGCKKDLD